MKRILSLLLLSVITVGFISCSSEKKEETKKELSTKDKLLVEAKRGLQNYINDRARNPETFKMSDTRIEYLSDSACVIKFRFVAENTMGGHVNGKAQWIWLKYNEDTYMSWQDSTDEEIYEFGESWIVENDALKSMSLMTVCMDIAENDTFAHSRIYKDDTAYFGDDYATLYCIVKSKGDKVKRKM